MGGLGVGELPLSSSEESNESFLSFPSAKKETKNTSFMQQLCVSPKPQVNVHVCQVLTVRYLKHDTRTCNIMQYYVMYNLITIGKNRGSVKIFKN